MRLTKEHVGAKWVAHDPAGNTYNGEISYGHQRFFLLSNHAVLGNANIADVERRGYGYAFQLGASPNWGHISEYVPMFSDFSINSNSNIIMRRSDSGSLFRKVFKRDGSMVFVGPVHKDIEKVEEPAGVIGIVENTYLDIRGWVPYVKELTAEEKVAAFAQKQKNA